MNSIVIETLILEAHLGVHPWEHDIAQTLLFDIELGIHIDAASASDKLADTVDYVAVCQTIEDELNKRHFQLLEALADHLATLIMAQFDITWLTLYVRKPDALAHTQSVGIRVTRGKP